MRDGKEGWKRKGEAKPAMRVASNNLGLEGAADVLLGCRTQ